MKTSEQVADIYAAFAKAQGEFTVARKDSDIRVSPPRIYMTK